MLADCGGKQLIEEAFILKGTEGSRNVLQDESERFELLGS